MFLCRQNISRRHAPKFPNCKFEATASHFVPAAAVAPQSNRPTVRFFHVQRDSCRLPKFPSIYCPPWASKCITMASASPKERLSLTLKGYMEQRRQNRVSIANLPDSAYLDLFSSAMAKRAGSQGDVLVQDVLEAFQGGSCRRETLLRAFLSCDFACLHRDIVFQVLQYLDRTSAGLKGLDATTVTLLVRMATRKSVVEDVDGSLLLLIHPLLVEHIQRSPAPGGAQYATYDPPSIVNAAFLATRRLLQLSFRQPALQLFQTLVKLRQIPSEAIQDTEAPSDDFNTIIFTTLVRASLHWNWRALSTILMHDILDFTPSLEPYILDLTSDVIYAHLNAPTTHSFRDCYHLIVRAHPHAPVSDSIIRRFYDAATGQRHATKEAESLYAFTRSSAVLQVHHYPPPQGLALTWLMSHFASASRKTHLSRILAKEVLHDNLSIPLQRRSNFIATAAAQGYGTLARGLWERHAVGKNKEFVVGDPGLMIRMVSLFANILKQTKARYRIAVKQSSTLPAELADMRALMVDMKAFLDRVRSEFVFHHSPLVKAHHTALTSLARADFILGKYRDGLKCFGILAHRKELPDIHDVNVALSAVAQLSLRLAIRLVGRMKDKGLHPDAVTFGTILHHALVQQDGDIVDEMIQQIKALGDEHPTLKSFTVLIQATIMPVEDESQAQQRAKLELARQLIASFPGINISAAPQLGKHLVRRCLEAEDPILAYAFWKMCLREGAQWTDGEQKQLRRLIAELIETHSSQLGEQTINAMLSKLGRGSRNIRPQTFSP